MAEGVVGPLAIGGSDAELLLDILMGVSSAVWITVDSRERDVIPRSVVGLAAVVTLIASIATVPLYVLWTRRSLGVVWVAVHLTGYVVTREAAALLAAAAGTWIR